MKKIYGLDLRSIAAFRVILATFIALEFGLMVLGNFTDIYSPETGILGNGFAKEYLSFYKNSIGIFFIDTDVSMKLFIWLIILSMILLAFGFYPRLMAALGCLWLYLFFNRYSVLYYGWEMYASVMLFWLIFIPSQASFSLFKKADNTVTKNHEWRSPLAFVLVFQIGFIYFYNGISKNGDLWMSGSALDSFLSETDKLTTAGIWLHSAGFTGLLALLTWITLIIEVGILFILFIPSKNSVFRYVAAILIFSLHWSIAIFADVGNFKYFATAVAILLLPQGFWQTLKHFVFRITKRTITIKQFQLPAFSKWNFKIPEKYSAAMLLLIIVFSNLSQTNASMTNDRMKKVIETTGMDNFFKQVNHRFLPQYSFFTQYWHLYSPDPPNEKGYLQVEVISANNDTIPIFNGVPFTEKRFHSRLQGYFFNYLLLKKGRNQKEKIAEKYLQLREIRLWNKHPRNPKMKALQLVIYSRPYSKNGDLVTDFERIAYKTIDIKYR